MINKLASQFKNALLLINRLKINKTNPTIYNKTRSMASSPLDSVPKVDIDPSGVFKYILIKLHHKDDNTEPVLIVRGYKRCNYHSDIYDEVQEKLQPLDCEPLGGGRISHTSDSKKIHIYGYSQGYGKADHEIAAKLIKDAYPGYTISVSDEGY